MYLQNYYRLCIFIQAQISIQLPQLCTENGKLGIYYIFINKIIINVRTKQGQFSLFNSLLMPERLFSTVLCIMVLFWIEIKCSFTKDCLLNSVFWWCGVLAGWVETISFNSHPVLECSGLCIPLFPALIQSEPKGPWHCTKNIFSPAGCTLW